VVKKNYAIWSNKMVFEKGKDAMVRGNENDSGY
jgi:hypothetical protein